LFESIGHEVTALKRVRFGGLELGDLRPGEWKELTRTEVEAAFARWPGRERRADRDW
jgi:16S rRNA U516 pseudouridylate synthase RsuA-like enzyme